ncbi:MAG: hypothetical protein A4S09_11990 [Proteobacteria bacterium SG_bin7]|nr:MAG: hypothetical protein A4S09_11990 [Proteobacteria bacterium SG_bin7]
MKSMRSLFLAITITLPSMAVTSSFESIMYNHYLKLARKYKGIKPDKNDYKEILALEGLYKTNEEKKKGLFEWLWREKVVTNLDEDYKDFGQNKETPPVKTELSEFNKLIKKFKRNTEKVDTIAKSEKIYQKNRDGLVKNQDICADRSKDDIIRRRLKAKVLESIRRENNGKLFRPSDSDDLIELNRLANKMFRQVCDRPPVKAKAVIKMIEARTEAKASTGTAPVVALQSVQSTAETTPTAALEETRPDTVGTVAIGTSTSTCDLEATARVFDGRPEDELKSTLALLFREASVHAMNENPEINLRLYVFYYLVNNQNNPAVGDPYDSSSLLAKIANCAREQGKEEELLKEKREHEGRSTESLKYYESFAK